MKPALRRLIAVGLLTVSCALPLAACDSDPKAPANDPGKPVTSADLTRLGCC